MCSYKSLEHDQCKNMDYILVKKLRGKSFIWMTHKNIDNTQIKEEKLPSLKIKRKRAIETRKKFNSWAILRKALYTYRKIKKKKMMKHCWWIIIDNACLGWSYWIYTFNCPSICVTPSVVFACYIWFLNVELHEDQYFNMYFFIILI